MELVPIQSVGEVGLIKDIPPYNLPPNAWSDGNNIRFLDNGVKKAAGYQEVMDDCPFSPFYVTPYLTVGGTYWWLAFGKQRIAGWSGTAWTDITR